MDTRALLLVFFIGAVSCEKLRPCSMDDLSPCLTAVTKSYILATKGEQAASLPPDPVSSMAVSEAMSLDISNPAADINKTCSVTANMDMDALGKCLTKTEEVCYSGLPTDMPEMIASTLPAMRTPTMGQSTSLSRKICTPGCMKPNFVYERVTAMKKCWKDNEAAVEAMLTGTEPQCGPVNTYMECTWQNAVGCDLLEALIRLHLQSLDNVITKCKPTLPAAATQEKAMVSSAHGLTAPGITQVVFQVLLTLAALTYINAKMRS